MAAVQPPPLPREVPCPGCGETVDIDGPLEDNHFVFEVRRDGTRSNLGWCPRERGMATAIHKARMGSLNLGGRGWYFKGKHHA